MFLTRGRERRRVHYVLRIFTLQVFPFVDLEYPKIFRSPPSRLAPYSKETTDVNVNAQISSLHLSE